MLWVSHSLYAELVNILMFPASFGAVIEEFEVRDALNSVLAAKGQIGTAGSVLE